ncbi:efflux RND transporter periplasmic adaptor subunit [Telmatobacter bradus]|uniref:efflux RND transporter periplasmic adaptor subunit n=1 Tax=Telmatobacter bradus TaxID=474953 RepID=UPI003B432300
MADQPVPVKVRLPNQAQQNVSVLAGGAVEGNMTAMAAFEVSGRVKKVYVEEGQQVKKGQVLAELDPTDYQHAYEASAGQADAARATEQKAKTGLRPEELEQARIAYEHAQDEYTRMKFLYDRKSLNANDFHKFEAAYLAAKQTYEMARKGSRNEDKSAAEAQTRSAVAQMQDAKRHLTNCRLLAPISGFIGMKHVNVGDVVAAGTPAFSVIDLESVKIRVAIPEAEVGKIRAGAAALVTVPSLAGQSYKGTLEALGISADPTSRTYTAKIAVANHDHQLRDGMVSQARIYGSQQIHVFTVPAEAIVRDARGIANVYVYYSDRRMAFARRVELGDFLGNELVITSGLAPSDQVIIVGQQNLREGSPVLLVGGVR